MSATEAAESRVPNCDRKYRVQLEMSITIPKRETQWGVSGADFSSPCTNVVLYANKKITALQSSRRKFPFMVPFMIFWEGETKIVSRGDCRILFITLRVSTDIKHGQIRAIENYAQDFLHLMLQHFPRYQIKCSTGSVRLRFESIAFK